MIFRSVTLAPKAAFAHELLDTPRKRPSPNSPSLRQTTEFVVLGGLVPELLLHKATSSMPLTCKLTSRSHVAP